MICALSFINGKVHFRSKYVATQQHMEEEKRKQFLYMGQMGTRNKQLFKDSLKALFSMVTGSVFNLQFRNPSNTNVFFWGGKVYRFSFILLHCSHQILMFSIVRGENLAPLFGGMI